MTSPIDAAKALHPIADVARRTGIAVPDGRGSSVTVRCPMPAHGHPDRTPSLRLYLDEDRWYCFACSPRTGDVVEWVTQSEGVSDRSQPGNRDHPRRLCRPRSREPGICDTIHKAQGRTVDRALLLGDDCLFAEAGYVGLSRGRTHNQLYVVADTNPLRPGLQPGSGLAEGVCHALGTSHAQTVAASHAAGRIPDAALPVLVAERDRLTDQLITTMPPPTRPGLDPQQTVHAARPRHDWTLDHRRDGERLARLTAAIDRRHQHLGLAALIDPPDHLTRLLGPPPDSPQCRQVWTETAAAVEAWREVSGRSADHGTRHLLAEPGIDRAEHGWWQQATRRLDTYQTRSLQDSRRGQLDAPDRELTEHDLPDLDRSWRPTTERGLNR